MAPPMQSWMFVVFVAASVLLYWLAVPRRWRPHFLLALSLGYYFVCSLNAFALPFFFLLFYLYGMFVVGILIDGAKTPEARKGWTVAGVVAAIAVLLFFKTTVTTTKLLLLFFGVGGGDMLAGALTRFGVPVGISYFSFRVIHYLIEVYRGKEKRATPLEFFLYVTFFPTMISGPIHRFYTMRREDPAESFANQLRGPGGAPTYNFDDITYGVWRILQGVVKKFVVADFFFRLCEPMRVPALLPTTEWWQLWLAGHAYFVYLYIDFSGYSDLAIGIARLFGFRVLENFNWGLFAPNMREYWRRWHMSLTNWLVNYVYIPLGGDRKGEFRTDFNTMVTLVAVAMWHRFALALFIWGLFQGGALVFLRHYLRLKKRLFPNRKTSWWGYGVGVFLVWNWMCFLWPLFLHSARIAFFYWVKMIPLASALKTLGAAGGGM